MQKFSEFTTNREIISDISDISDNDMDMDISSDDYMEVDEEEEIEIGYFDLTKEWIEKIKQIGNSLSYVRKFMDADLPEERNEDSFGDAFLFEESMLLKKRHKTPVAKIRGSYRKYTVEQIEKLFDLIIEEGSSIKYATLVTGINIRTAQKYIKTYNNDSQKQLPGSYNKPRGRLCTKLTEEYSKFLVDYVKKKTTAVLEELKLKLCEKLKKLEKISSARNSDRVIALRKAIVEQYKSDTDMAFSKSCVFLDKAGFNLHTQRNYGRSLKGTPAKSTVPTGKGVTFTILGAISR